MVPLMCLEIVLTGGGGICLSTHDPPCSNKLVWLPSLAVSGQHSRGVRPSWGLGSRTHHYLCCMLWVKSSTEPAPVPGGGEGDAALGGSSSELWLLSH